MASQTVKCDVCGKSFKASGLSIHKTRIHEGRNWKNTSGVKKATKLRKKAIAKPQQHELRELWTDSEGRILLVDEAGDWWVAKKLDI